MKLMKHVAALAAFTFLVIAALSLSPLLALAQDAGNGLAADCEANETVPCGSNIGECRQGIRTCVDGTWSECLNEVEPVREVCGNKLDDDCDGDVDECGGDYLWMVMIGVVMLVFLLGYFMVRNWTDKY